MSGYSCSTSVIYWSGQFSNNIINYNIWNIICFWVDKLQRVWSLSTEISLQNHTFHLPISLRSYRCTSSLSSLLEIWYVWSHQHWGYTDPRSEHISPLLQNLHWLPVNKRTQHKVATLCHTSLSGSGPQYLSDLTHIYTPARSLHSSSYSHILSTLNVKLKSYGQHSFAYHGPTTWNSLPLALRYQQESDCFKPALKTHLFSLN